MASKIEKYGAQWDASLDPLAIELACIRRGGEWVFKGQKRGAGLFEHFMNARKMLWPDRYRHRWTELIYSEIIQNMVTILMGSGSSQKTSHAAEFVLIDYWAHPEDTLVLLSTTTVDKLDLAIFGELKMLFHAARAPYPWLAGNPLESKRAITTDNLEYTDVRDIRRGIVGRALYVGKQYVGLGSWAGIKQKRIRFIADELQFCFISGTLVDTPHGPRAIEAIQPGDIVMSAAGPSRVRKTMSRLTETLVRIVSKDGHRITCTPNHRIFTQKGWVKACNLGEEYYMLSTYEAMQILRSPVRPETFPASVPSVFGQTKSHLQTVRETIFGPHSSCDFNSFLQSELLREMDAFQAGSEGQDLHPGESSQVPGIEAGVVSNGGRKGTEGAMRCQNERVTPYAQPGNLSQGGSRYSGSRLSSSGSRGEWYWTVESRMAAHADVSRRPMELRGQDRNEARERIPPVLQARPGVSADKTGNRGRRSQSQQSVSTWEGSKEGSVPQGSWVDHIAILKPGDPGFSASGGDHRGCRVYNLEVEGHPSYSVGGLLVHNCAPTFFDCLPNMFQSAGLDAKGDPDVKIIGSGNPKHDPYDQLSIAAEPVEGWDSVTGDPKHPKTQCWDTKFHRGRCVNLIGTDSPNFDVPEGQPPPFPRLISRNSIRPVEARWGKDSLQYYTQCVGKMMMGMQGNRVLTTQLCENHRAFDTAFWKGNDQTRIAFTDPAWGGGDRCIFGWLEFGTAINDMEIIRFGEYMEVPIIANKKVDPDDQIAQFARMQCTRLVIPGSNLFYGSTGRGTTGAAFARVFGTDAPVAIAEGDRPTPRPVRWDLFVIDPVTKEKRLKRCDEEYGRLNAELWFSVRNVVECDQFREMPREVVREFSLREYTTNRSGKVELESKEDTKERMGVSPDLADALSFGVEGARQRGFQIGRLDYQIVEQDEDDFFEEEAKLYREAIESRLLNHRV